MQMQFFAFGAKCGGLTARGDSGSAAVRRPSSARSEARARRPTPLALVARKSRRAWSAAGCMAGSGVGCRLFVEVRPPDVAEHVRPEYLGGDPQVPQRVCRDRAPGVEHG